jgi:signal peptidase I
MSAPPERIEPVAEEPEAQEAPAPAVAETENSPHARRLKRYRYLLPVLIFVAFLVWGFTSNYIPSESMLPTLKPGDHVLTMRSWLAYPGGRVPARGDIIVFAIPELPELDDYGETEAKRTLSERRQKQVVIPPGSLRHVKGDILIKRVVGLPGETVQIKGSDIYINGKKLEQRHFGGDPDPFAWFNFAVDEPLTLKNDQIFVLGDNIANSEDSRTWGPLDLRNVIGKFAGVLWNDGSGKEANASKLQAAAKP